MLDLSRQYASIRDEVLAAIARVCDSHDGIAGEKFSRCRLADGLFGQSARSAHDAPPGGSQPSTSEGHRAGARRCAQGRLSAHVLHTLPMEKWMLTSHLRTLFVGRGSLSG